MRSLVAILALVLTVLTVTAPAVEALAGCLEACQDETTGQGECSSDACCSCCVHTGPMFVPPPPARLTLAPVGPAAAPRTPHTPLGRSSDILHVPKLSAA